MPYSSRRMVTGVRHYGDFIYIYVCVYIYIYIYILTVSSHIMLPCVESMSSFVHFKICCLCFSSTQYSAREMCIPPKGYYHPQIYHSPTKPLLYSKFFMNANLETVYLCLFSYPQLDSVLCTRKFIYFLIYFKLFKIVKLNACRTHIVHNQII